MKTERRQSELAVDGGTIRYRVVGTGEVPLIVVAGGPGCPSRYLASLERLADGRPVVFYDQLGCGDSDPADDPSLWRFDRFVDEVEQLRLRLGTDRVDVIGHSWGAMVALGFAVEHPDRVRKLVLASGTADMPLHIAEVRTLVEAMPDSVREAIADPESAGYAEALEAFMARHLLTVPPPGYVEVAISAMNADVYGSMWGPDEVRITGSLREWTLAGRLGDVQAPTLVIVGGRDHMGPLSAAQLADGIPEARLVVCEHSAHMAFLEEPETFFAAVEGFLV